MIRHGRALIGQVMLLPKCSTCSVSGLCVCERERCACLSVSFDCHKKITIWKEELLEIKDSYLYIYPAIFCP